jgi:hypothetical protein
MQHGLRRGVLALLLAAAGVVAAQDGKDPPALDPKKQQEYDRLAQAGAASGRILKVGSGTLTFELVETTVQPGPINPKNGMPRPRLVTTRLIFDLPVADDAGVRSLKAPLRFDDKGKPKPYTPEELEELRGPDASLPGYTSSFDDLKPGHIVKLIFGPKRGSPRGPDADKDKSKENEKPTYNRPLVTMIIIAAEGQPPPAPKGKKK